MAPVCVCGHKASEHKKQMRMRTYCEQYEGTANGYADESWDCGCRMYKPSISGGGYSLVGPIYDEAALIPDEVWDGYEEKK